MKGFLDDLVERILQRGFSGDLKMAELQVQRLAPQAASR
jgi:hypothetical protein